MEYGGAVRHRAEHPTSKIQLRREERETMVAARARWVDFGDRIGR